MTRHEFVDMFRSRDAREKDPHMRRVKQHADTSDVLYCMLFILSVTAIVVGLCTSLIGILLQRYDFLWTLIVCCIGVAGLICTRNVISPMKYELLPIDVKVLKTYTGEYIFIHWLNDVTGYTDEWVPFYGNTEEFVRYYNGKPELCVAPMEQYGRGWIAYAHKPQKEEVPTRRNTHEIS